MCCRQLCIPKRDIVDIFPIRDIIGVGVRIISRKALQEFWIKHRDAEQALKAWYHEANHADWKKPGDIKNRYPTADVLPGNRVVFNIKGDQYRLVVKIHYNTGIIYIRFVGTHAEYDRVDAERV